MDQSPRAAHARFGLYVHLAVYVLVNLLLIGINLATSPHSLWFVWPLAGWGLGVLLHIGLIVGVPRLRALKAGMVKKSSN